MKVLIIEDSKALSKALTIGLENNGYDVEHSLDGQEGLSLIQINDYDIILLDLMLPSLDGASILQTIRSEKNDVPVLVLSAKVELTDKTSLLLSGADDYLCKPFEFDELLARMVSLLRRRAGSASNQLHLKDQLYLDLFLNKLTNNGEEIKLTHKEYMLLELLANHKGKVIDYDRINNHLYDVDKMVTQNTIETHVSNIRKKLKQVGISDLIQTKYSVGFFIETY